MKTSAIIQKDINMSIIEKLSNDECRRVLNVFVRRRRGRKSEICECSTGYHDIVVKDNDDLLFILGFKMNSKYASIDFKMKDSWKQVLKDMMNWCHDGQYVACFTHDYPIMTENINLEEAIIQMDLEASIE